LLMYPEEGGTTCPRMSLFAVSMEYNSSTMRIAVKTLTVTAYVNTHSKSFILINNELLRSHCIADWFIETKLHQILSLSSNYWSD
jgi:hypothetical protein